MKRIGLLSDTHGHLPEKTAEFFENCDEIWHAGDIGNQITAQTLNDIKPLKAVYGNIDGGDIRTDYPEYLFFDCEMMRVLMLHIGGYPGRYTSRARELIKTYRPSLFISGHSHILKVIYDNKFQLLHINPGAAGKQGFHQVRTLLRFTIDGDRVEGLEILELKRH
ncbi:metallophosphoesterase family protein [Lentimicrobium sp.]